MKILVLGFLTRDPGSFTSELHLSHSLGLLSLPHMSLRLLVYYGMTSSKFFIPLLKQPLGLLVVLLPDPGSSSPCSTAPGTTRYLLQDPGSSTLTSPVPGTIHTNFSDTRPVVSPLLASPWDYWFICYQTQCLLPLTQQPLGLELLNICYQVFKPHVPQQFLGLSILVLSATRPRVF